MLTWPTNYELSREIFLMKIPSYSCFYNTNVLVSYCCYNEFVVVQSLSRVWFSATPWTAASQASLSFPISWSLLKLMSIESVMSSNHLILCCLPSPPALNFSQHQGLFKWVFTSGLFTSGGQSTGVSASTSVLPMNIQGWFSLGLTGLISWL